MSQQAQSNDQKSTTDDDRNNNSNNNSNNDRAARSPAALLTMLGLGVLSAILYFLLYQYGNDVRYLAEITNAGDKEYFYVPVLIAIVFSFVHGAFTGHFWDVLGLKAKK